MPASAPPQHHADLKQPRASVVRLPQSYFFFFNDPAPPEIYTLPLHDAFPIYATTSRRNGTAGADKGVPARTAKTALAKRSGRSEEHTSELQSLRHLVCRL